MAKKEKTYTEAMQELQDILAKIENDDVDVDVLSIETKKAIELIKLCKEKLYKTNEEVKKILDNME
ncbi:exodeoxyribonuclease VII small subunit [Dysgonomonas sp. 520]|uniref:exodeoxyribonuclease VII small subunit n=1 Tax=Dysgonomonas sp. 520 TaxID=2302931 RepID=UPI0013D4A655|nr:exodeoxyribonuclease VII small subunit [Dysgonomonas sp. 520]NDW08414.1 exodeoxyribonuclease VII small subunit [Dysgonomonas sp. 520]